jgi:glutathione S-transferase
MREKEEGFSMATLYYCETLNPQKVCAVAKHLNVPLDYVRVELKTGEHKTPEHLARHPQGRVPVLVNEGECIWESAAIMTWLSIRAGSDLWPAHEPDRQVEVLRWMLWDAFTWLPAAGPFYFEHHIKPLLGFGVADEAALAAKTPAFHQAAQLLDAQLATRAFVTGDKLSIADFAIGATLPYAERIHLPLAPYANIRRWHGRLMELEAWRNPWPG